MTWEEMLQHLKSNKIIFPILLVCKIILRNITIPSLGANSESPINLLL